MQEQVLGKEKLLTEAEIKTLNDYSNNGCTISEWDSFCDSVKFDSERKGEYPKDWFQKVILSGKATEITYSSKYLKSKDEEIDMVRKKIQEQKNKKMNFSKVVVYTTFSFL